MKHDVALKVAEALVEHLRPACERIEIKGSVSRFKPGVKNIEILVVPDLSKVARAPLVFGQPVPRLYATKLDQVLDEMVKDNAIRLDADGSRMKKLYLKYAGIAVDLFICIPPSDWGVSAVIRTGPADFSHWCVTNKSKGGGLPNGCFVKHQVVWIANEISKDEVGENADKAIELLTAANHLSMSEEIDFLKFVGLDWIEPKDRVAKWMK
mgnify:CR=1 FL=1